MVMSCVCSSRRKTSVLIYSSHLATNIDNFNCLSYYTPVKDIHGGRRVYPEHNLCHLKSECLETYMCMPLFAVQSTNIIWPGSG